MEMTQDLSCDTFEDLKKGNQVSYEGMCTEAAHEYEQIFYSNEWSPLLKGKYYNEEARLTQAYMTTIDSLVNKKIQ